MNCELLEGARDLAIQRGLPVDEVTCPTENICEGSFCVYLRDEEDEVDDIAINRFYDRLEKHFKIKGVIFEGTTKP